MLRRIIPRVILLVLIAYVGLMVLGCAVQRRLIYYPQTAPLETLTVVAHNRGYSAWKNASGQFIGWKKIDPGHPHPALLITHGNAGSAIHRLHFADALQKLEPWDVYILEYPGYGARPGVPSEKSFFAAADEALALAKQNGPLYLLGESLGTGVASHLAGTHPADVQGVLLIAPFNKLSAVAQYHLPYLLPGLFLVDRYPSETYLLNYHGPVAFLLAGKDEIVPNRFGRKLYDGYSGPKMLRLVPEAGHNGLLEEPDDWWRELSTFWKREPRPNATGGH